METQKNQKKSVSTSRPWMAAWPTRAERDTTCSARAVTRFGPAFFGATGLAGVEHCNGSSFLSEELLHGRECVSKRNDLLDQICHWDHTLEGGRQWRWESQPQRQHLVRPPIGATNSSRKRPGHWKGQRKTSSSPRRASNATAKPEFKHPSLTSFREL